LSFVTHPNADIYEAALNGGQTAHYQAVTSYSTL
jgi:hypothetical protein